MKAQVYKKSKSCNYVKAAKLIKALLMVLTWLATATGFTTVMSASGEPELSVVIAGYALSAAIVLIGNLSIMAYFKKPKLRYLVGATAAIATSVLLGMSYFGTNFGFVEQFMNDQTNNAVYEQVKEASKYVRNFNKEFVGLNALKNHSSKEAALEASKERKGCFIICNERKTDTLLIQQYHEKMSSDLAELNQLLDNIRNTTDLKQIQVQFGELNILLDYLSTSPGKIDFITFLEQASKKWQRNGKNAKGQKLWREDITFVSLAQSTIKGLNNIKVAPIEIDLLSGESASLVRSGQVILFIISGDFDQVQASDWFALSLALIVDLGIIYLSFVTSELNWMQSRVDSAGRESTFKIELIKDLLLFSQIKTGRDLTLLLEKNAKETKEYVFIKSLNGNDEKLDLICSALEGMEITSKKIKHDITLIFDFVFRKTNQPNTYKIPRDAYVQIKKAAYQFDRIST